VRRHLPVEMWEDTAANEKASKRKQKLKKSRDKRRKQEENRQ
jgi:hypothetical protein